MKKQDCTSGPSYCPNCGREVPSSKFCLSCNFDLTSKNEKNKTKK